MSFKKALRRYFEAWERSISLLEKPVVLVPFVLLAIIQIVPLVMTTFFVEPPLSYFMVPTMHTLFGEEALHYPTHFVMLPDIFRVFAAPFVLLFGYSLLGWGVLMLIDLCHDKPVRFANYLAGVRILLPSILAIGSLFVLLDYGVQYAGILLDRATSGLFGDVAVASVRAAGFVSKVFLVYSLFFLGLYRETAGPAIRRSIRFARRRFMVTGLVILSAYLMRAFVDFVLAESFAQFAFDETHVLVAVVAGVLVESFALYYVLSATTFLGLRKREVV
jgi:hypothetical protein